MTPGLAIVLLLAATAAAVATGWWWRRRSRRRRAATWRRAHQLFTRLVELPSDDRTRILAEEALDDPTLADSVTRLLAAHDVTGPLDRMQARLGRQEVVTEALSPPVDQATATVVAGHYRLLGRLGAGGMGEVHRAHDDRLGREVALKFLTTQGDPGGEARQRFIREAQAAAALDHPNLCVVHEIGEADDGRLFIAMALYDGETVADRIRRGPLEWTEAVAIARQVARGLACAHAAGIVHRDIKPANICVTRDGVAKIVDFGIAMVSGTTIGDAGPLLGTVAYMSPEQVQGQLAAEQSDLWSLGVVCYEMLTASRLFGGSEWLQVMAEIRGDQPLPLGALRGTAPLPVIRVIRQLLERDPARRPTSADQVDRLLGEALREADRPAPPDGRAAEALAADGERRQVTVAVCLPQPGTAALSDSLVAEVLARHGGHCIACDEAQLVLVFGVPRTHEDDQLRAALACAELHELASLGATPDLQSAGLAIGIASATVAVRADPGQSGSFRLDGTVRADAGRLAAAARPGAILLYQPNLRALGGAFEVEPREPVDDGDGPPLSEVVALRPVGGASIARADRAPQRLTDFAGRQRELEALHAALEAVQHGEGRVVTVTGEAGSGKSRLVREFLVSPGQDDLRVVAGHCQSYGGSKPYHPFIEAVRQLLSLDADDRSILTADAVGTALDAIDPMLANFLPHYLHLLTVGGGERDPAQAREGGPTRQVLRDALIALFTQAALARPMVVRLEDWHWADEASSDVLRHLAAMTGSCPMLIVVTQRTDESPAWQGASTGTLLRLAPLPLDDSGTIARAILGVPALSDEIAETLHERSGGNPFYLEELCRSLREGDLLVVDRGRATLSREQDQLHLPATIQGIIRSRLDRLDPGARELVRAAAVLGRDFSLPMLVRMGLERYALTQMLQSLVGLGLVQQTRLVPERAYRFAHALIHEVAYDTLLPHQRQELHRRAARALVAEYGDHLEEQASRIALQYEGSEEWLDAARYAAVAARRSRRLYEPADALATLESADAWLDREPAGAARDEMRMTLLLDAEAACETLGLQDRQGEYLQRLLELQVVREDPQRLAEVHRRRGDRLTLLRRFSQAHEELALALELSRRAGDRALEGKVLRSQGLVGWHSGNLEPALPHLEAAIALERERGDLSALGSSLLAHAQLLRALGRTTSATEELQEALEITEQMADPSMTSVMLYTLSTDARALGDLDRATEFLERATALEPELGNPVFGSYNLVARAHLRLLRGELDQALRFAELAVDEARRCGFAEVLARSLQAHGEMLAGLDRSVEASERLEEAAAVYEQLGRPDMVCRLRARAATAAEQSGDLVLAHRVWQRCLDLPTERIGGPAEVRARLGVARTGRRIGTVDAATARAEFGRALELATALEMLEEQAQAHNSLGVMEWERGALAGALPHFEAALDLFGQLDDTPHLAFMHNSLGATLRGLGRHAEARHHLEAALPIARTAGRHQLEGHALALLGEVALDAGDPARARELVTQSLALRVAHGDQRGEGWMHEALARIDLQRGERKAALANQMRARGIALRLGDHELLAASDALTISIPVAQEG